MRVSMGGGDHLLFRRSYTRLLLNLLQMKTRPNALSSSGSFSVFKSATCEPGATEFKPGHGRMDSSTVGLLVPFKLVGVGLERPRIVVTDLITIPRTTRPEPMNLKIRT
ncbi:hypothetical protein EVAR_35756_1 [Eumeta japonica]|uniref:Uncharacterized protein n=1 Tax=Eumeta variegata TaxID=151549 RepID=A0A4C1VG68_EUMVA|nr:hypothetical protein EVAR_35756_1 [Eumeta japonica]